MPGRDPIDNYWLRRGVTRRRFLGGAAATGVGAAALGLVGCGDDDDTPKSTATAAATTAGATGSATAASTGTTAATKTKGGIVRASSANNTWDTFDTDRSRFTPFAVIIGRTNLGVVHYKSFEKGELEGGFAESWQQPDSQTLILKVRPNIVWQNKAPVNGRAGKADDIKFFLERNKAGTVGGKEDKNFWRQAEFAGIDSVTLTDASTVTVKFAKPNPFFLTTLAGAYTKVQAPEAVAKFEGEYNNLKAEQIIGTGANTLEEFTAEGSVKWRKFAKHALGESLVDGWDWIPLFTDNAALQAAFEQKQIDVFGPRTVDVQKDLLKRYDKQIYNTSSFSANPMAGTYYGGAAPWNNKNLIGAIFRTIDRRTLIQQLFQGSGALSGNIPPPQGAFGLTEKELIALPGYLEDRAKDLAEAKKMWDAGGGPALGEILIDIPDIWEGAYSGVGASIQKMLKDNLGGTWNIKLEPYSTISTKVAQSKYGNGTNNIWYGWISDIQKLEPTLDLFQAYNSKAPGFSQFGVKIDEVDAITDKAILELDPGKRKEYDRQVNKLLIENWGAGIPYNMVQVSNTLRWNYLKTGESPAFVSVHNEFREAWLDQNDPTWKGRPA